MKCKTIWRATPFLENSNSKSEFKYLKIGVVNESIAGSVEIDKLLSQRAGFSVDIVKALCEYFRYTCDFTIVPSNVYGNLADGNWTGMLGDLFNQKFNTTLPVFTVDSQRIMDFDIDTNAGILVKKYFIIRSPYDQYYTFNIFKPWSMKLWLAVAASLLVINVVTIVYKRCRLTEIFGVFVTVLMLLARKSTSFTQSSNSASQIVMCCWGLVCIFLISSYSNGLLASMLRSRLSLPFSDLNTLVECVEKKQCTMITTTSGNIVWKAVIASPPGNIYYRMNLALRNNPVIVVNSTKQMLTAILQTQSRFLVTFPHSLSRLAEVSFRNEDSSCKFATIYFESVVETFAFRKRDKLNREFNGFMEKLNEAGIIRKLVENYTDQYTCQKVRNLEKLSVLSLPIDLFGSHIYLLLGGFSFAILGFLGEKVSHLWKNKRQIGCDKDVSIQDYNL